MKAKDLTINKTEQYGKFVRAANNARHAGVETRFELHKHFVNILNNYVKAGNNVKGPEYLKLKNDKRFKSAIEAIGVIETVKRKIGRELTLSIEDALKFAFTNAYDNTNIKVADSALQGLVGENSVARELELDDTTLAVTLKGKSLTNFLNTILDTAELTLQAEETITNIEEFEDVDDDRIEYAAEFLTKLFITRSTAEQILK